MPYFKRCKTVLILRILLMSSVVLLPQFTRIEAAVLHASPCTLAWNISTNSSAVGYALYYGITGSGVTNRLDGGMTNTVILYNLLASSNYFFYAVAYDNKQTESLPSEVVCYNPCALSALKMTKLAGASMNLQFWAAPGSACHVEYTTTLNPPQWQTLGGATADSNGNITLCDPLTGRPPARFYRAALP
jgi:hypothetical protein